MPRLHRLTATLLAHLLAIHFAIMGGAVACPMEHAMAPAGAASVHAAHAGSEASAASPDRPHHSHGDAASHDTSCTSGDCVGGAHCGALAPRADAPATAELAAARLARPVALDAPRSVSTAPEPPPPRA